MPLQKDWLFLKKLKKNLMSSETESIVKYLFWDCYVLFWPPVITSPFLTPLSA